MSIFSQHKTRIRIRKIATFGGCLTHSSQEGSMKHVVYALIMAAMLVLIVAPAVFGIDSETNIAALTTTDRGTKDEVMLTYDGSALWQGSSGVCVAGNYAYLFLFYGILVFDLSNPSAPINAVDLFDEGSTYKIRAQAGNHIYTESYGGHFCIIDISIPDKPSHDTQLPATGLDARPGRRGKSRVHCYGFHAGNIWISRFQPRPFHWSDIVSRFRPMTSQ